MFIRAPSCIATPPPLSFEAPSSPLDLDDELGDDGDISPTDLVES
jgi:hypothetical protein